MEMAYTVRENVSFLMITVELAPSSGTLLDNITLYVSSIGGSATGIVLIIDTCSIVSGTSVYIWTLFGVQVRPMPSFEQHLTSSH